MPRRRATKASNAENQRPGPMLPEGDEGKDMDHELKKEKVQTLMKDFKSEVDSRIKNLRARITEMLNQIDLAYTMELMQIPPDIRQMQLSDFLKNGGSFVEAPVSQDLHQQIQSVIQSSVAAKERQLAVVNEEDQTVRQSRRRKNVENSETQPVATIAKKGRPKKTMVCETPSNYQNSASWPTPIITPKFDPRLYQTPAVHSRAPKPGDKIITMTIDGSPIDNTITMKTFATNDINLDASMSQDEINAAMSKIEMMKAKLTAMSNFSKSTNEH